MRVEPTDEAAGTQVRIVRTARGVSLRTLARMIEVSPATLSQIEQGKTRLSVPRLGRIADALDVSVAQILDTALDGTDDAHAPHPTPTPSSAWQVFAPLDFDPVLRAALDEFVHIGYHGATVRSIAARAGLSVPGIYHHYDSKQQMLMAIERYTMADLLARAEAARAEGSDPVERFGVLVELLALYHTHRAELGFVGAAEKRSLDPVNSRAIARQRTTQQRMVDREVTDAVRAGQFRTDKPHERARAIVTMCTALPTWWRPDGAYSPEQIAQQYVTFALDLMTAAAPAPA